LVDYLTGLRKAQGKPGQRGRRMTTVGTKQGEGGKKTHRRREEVLAAIAQIFYTKGYDAASIQDIADEVGILKGSLYYYISSKEDVLFELIQSYHDATREYFEDIVRSTDSVVVKLRRFIETETAHTARNLVKSSLFYTEWKSLSDERQGIIIAQRDRHDKFVQECINDGQGKGIFRTNLNPKIASLGILGMVNSVYRWYKPDGDSSAEEVGQSFADLVLAGLEVNDGTLPRR
jgi:AcrR family transcriptional regulator